MKKIRAILLSLALILCAGCSPTRTWTEPTTVTVVDAYMRILPMRAGKVTTFRRSYRTTFLYNKEKIAVSNSKIYHYCKDKEGKDIKVNIKFSEWKNGKITKTIESFVEE